MELIDFINVTQSNFVVFDGEFLGSGSNKGNDPDFTDAAKGLWDHFSSLLISGAKKNESLPYPLMICTS